MTFDNSNMLDMYTIYDHPLDYPDEFVARLWQIVSVEGKPEERDGGIVARGQTLQAVRDALPPYLCQLPREPGDDPNIVETWI